MLMVKHHLAIFKGEMLKRLKLYLGTVYESIFMTRAD